MNRSYACMERVVARNLVLLVAMLAASGCNDSGLATVEGTVTLDGAPLKQGSITFTPIGQTKGPVAGGTIIEGKYRIDSEKGAAVGTNRVQIRGVWATGQQRTVGEEIVEEYVEMVPPKYH